MAVERERRKWTADQYDMMVTHRIIVPSERVELLEGEVYVMTPQGPHHSFVVGAAADLLGGAAGPGFYLRTQMPLATGGWSTPEPDVAVVRGSRRDHLATHPRSAELVVEVADSTLNTDRLKAAIYAEAKVPEYWVVDLPLRRLEVYREPEKWGGTWRYASVQVFEQGAQIVPVSFPEARIAVRDLLP